MAIIHTFLHSTLAHYQVLVPYGFYFKACYTRSVLQILEKIFKLTIIMIIAT